jgi:hypothetical protein
MGSPAIEETPLVLKGASKSCHQLLQRLVPKPRPPVDRGAWIHNLWLIALGLLIILLAWATGQFSRSTAGSLCFVEQ